MNRERRHERQDASPGRRQGTLVTPGEVSLDGEHAEETYQQLRLSHRIGDHLHVDRMDGEQRGGDHGRRLGHHSSRQSPDQDRRPHGKEDVDEMEDEGISAPDGPFQSKELDGQRPIGETGRPVSGCPDLERVGQMMDQGIPQDDVGVVIHEPVHQARCRGRERQGRDEHPRPGGPHPSHFFSPMVR